MDAFTSELWILGFERGTLGRWAKLYQVKNSQTLTDI
jgi:hypothetical protein